MNAPTDYLLQLADTALVLAQRNAEWCGHGPVLEEDLAMANISLDLIGQARYLYQYAAAGLGGDASEDRLAYFRDANEYRCLTLVELPNHGPRSGGAACAPDYATTIVRNFLHAALMALLWAELQHSSDTQLAAIAARSVKEARYHLRHCGDWLLRFGDGTAESHARAQAALDHLWPYTQEFWTPSPAELAACAHAGAPHPASLHAAWDNLVDAAIAAATLQRPPNCGFLCRGKFGQHSEHLSYLLAEMQVVARAHPDAVW